MKFFVRVMVGACFLMAFVASGLFAPAWAGTCTFQCQVYVGSTPGRVSGRTEPVPADNLGACHTLCTITACPTFLATMRSPPVGATETRCVDSSVTYTETTPTADTPTAPTRSSNTQGTAGARAAPTAAATSGSCALNGVHDPFCNLSIQGIIGRVVKFFLGIAGALFLAMFVYGGAVWLTAGSSDRHEQAKKTLLNAAAGVLIVIGSYTMVAVLLRFVGGLGVSQGNVEATEEAPTTQEAATPAPTPAATPEETPTGCHETRFTDACAASCAGTGTGDACVAMCWPLYSQVCPGGATPLPTTSEGRTAALTACQSLCANGCSTILRAIDPGPGGTAMRSAFVSFGCASTCPTWCRAAFSETRAVGR